MSYCREEGKDRIIFVTQEDHEEPSTANVDFEDDDDEPGLILPNGEINWSCPCLGGMATGPCGQEFKEAFSCFHYSNAEVKGSNCLEEFRSMQNCMREYPELYPDKDDEEDDGVEEKDTVDIPNAQGGTEEQTSNTRDTRS
ncbi:mitochondrial intermembrane space import and assembly protein 40 [Saccoglossus kowalevskii]|uniref:Mitochondrial intermembrane space import and assembly protein 40 n=1 Tax=Saccoglossus kowalevskii TaxID=10224 RepID=A0ABM0GGY8_SACKO|nr:mitochondrial intermembrane space import and assembly protein 40 [Saccoglossus kowalevskii]